MTNHPLISSVIVSASPQGDGLIMSITNASNEELRIRFPNPYTGIRLYTEAGELVPMSRTFLCWEENDPEIVLLPGQSASALASLYPFWDDLYGAYLAKCTLKLYSQGGEQDVVAEGGVQIAVKASGLDRPTPSSTAPVMKPTLMNVSRYVCILGQK
jgi:hypothetical protein